MHPVICGIDEAGRGPLAGPVCAAAVILDPSKPVRGLRDSKKLSARQRTETAIAIRESALAWAIGWASVQEIDERNILSATLLAMKRAYDALGLRPDQLLIDGLHCPDVGRPARAVVRGDALVPAISAASILAKTARDAEMLRLHELHPAYEFDRHKGYPTVAHLTAIARHGVLDIHRRSYAPIQRMLGGAGIP